MLKIRDFARLVGVSMTTLRYYDEIGLLKPIHVDPETGYRFYTMDQLPQLHRILALKELGLGLTQIAEILNDGVSPRALQGMLRLKQAQLQQQIQAEQYAPSWPFSARAPGLSSVGNLDGKQCLRHRWTTPQDSPAPGRQS